MELVERVNLREIEYLNSFTFADYSRVIYEYNDQRGRKRPTKEDMKANFNWFKQYLKGVIKTRGETKRIYSYSLSTPNGSSGRLFSGGSLQGFSRLFSSFLLQQSNCTDIDQVNAHPTILRYICKKHDIPCPQLEFYINNRDRCLSEFSNREEGKTLYLVATNLDQKLKSVKSAQLKLYDAEMKTIQKQLVKMECYKYIHDNLPLEKKNFNGSAINRILCFYENQILQHALHVITRREIEIAVLMFDGCVVYGNHYEDQTLLEEITCYVNEQMPNLNMRWSYKPLVSSLSIPEGFVPPPKEVPYRIVSDDAEAATLIYEELKDRLKYARDTFFFKLENVWLSKAKDVKSCLEDYIMASNIKKTNADGDIKPFAQNVTGAANICKALLNKVQVIAQTEGSDIYDLFHSTTKGRLAFQDGVLDIPTKTFHPWASLPWPFYTCKIIKRPFGDWYAENKDNDTVYRDITTTIFEPLFGDKLDLALKFLSRAIAGHSEDKHMATYLGSRDCGKGVIYELLNYSFGDYVQTFDLANVSYERATDTSESARKSYWLFDMEFARISVSQETPPPSRNVKVNSQMIKRICGGGDTQKARRNFDTDDSALKLDTTLFLFGNNSINFDSPDVLDHCLEFSSAVQFKSAYELQAIRDNYDRSRDEQITSIREEKQGQPEEKIEEAVQAFTTSHNAECELLMKSFREKDDRVKDKCREVRWMNACVLLLTKNYETTPVNCVKKLEELDESQMGVRQALLMEYEITREEKDIVVVAEVVRYLGREKRKIEAEVTSFGLQMKKSYKRDETRNKVCIYGMKLKQEKKVPGEAKAIAGGSNPVIGGSNLVTEGSNNLNG